MTIKLSSLPLAILLAATLSACGGGGGGGTSSAAAPTNPTPTPPAPTPVAQNLQAAVAPTYAANSEELGFFNAINAFRTAEGLGPLNQNPCYDKAAAAHYNYEMLNIASQGESHYEVSGSPGFTGVAPSDRLTAQGCVFTAASEVIGGPLTVALGQPGVGADSARGLIDSVYHRADLMYQGLTDIGIAVGTSTSAPFTIADIGYKNPQINSGSYFGTYPVANQSGVRLSAVEEIPNPFPSSVTNVSSQTGYPISVASQASTTLTVTTFTVTQAGSSKPMATYPIYTDQDPNLAGSINLAFLVTTQAFLPNTTYTVHFVGTITGTATGSSKGIAVDQTWGFTTGSGN